MLRLSTRWTANLVFAATITLIVTILTCLVKWPVDTIIIAILVFFACIVLKGCYNLYLITYDVVDEYRSRNNRD